MPNSALTRTVRVVTAYLAANKCPQADVPTLIERVHAALTRTSAPSKTLAPPALTQKQIAASITPDFLISFERLCCTNRLQSGLPLSPDRVIPRPL